MSRSLARGFGKGFQLPIYMYIVAILDILLTISFCLECIGQHHYYYSDSEDNRSIRGLKRRGMVWKFISTDNLCFPIDIWKGVYFLPYKMGLLDSDFYF